MSQVFINSLLLGIYFAVLLAIGWACRRIDMLQLP